MAVKGQSGPLSGSLMFPFDIQVLIGTTDLRWLSVLCKKREVRYLAGESICLVLHSVLTKYLRRDASGPD